MEIITIEKTNTSAVKTIAQWVWQEWGHPNNYNYWESWIYSSTNPNDIPMTFAAIENGRIIGAVSLWRCDLQSR